LREAINAAASGDAFQFASNVHGTIVLGGSELLISENQTIVGSGAGTLKVAKKLRTRVSKRWTAIAPFQIIRLDHRLKGDPRDGFVSIIVISLLTIG